MIGEWVDSRIEQGDVLTTCGIAERLQMLADESLDEEDQEPMQPSSLADALRFLNQRPSLTLSPNGHISASWSIFGHRLIIRFLGNGEISMYARKVND